MLVLMYEGGEEKLPTNINFLLEQWGIFAKPDAIVRCSTLPSLYYCNI